MVHVSQRVAQRVDAKAGKTAGACPHAACTCRGCSPHKEEAGLPMLAAEAKELRTCKCAGCGKEVEVSSGEAREFAAALNSWAAAECGQVEERDDEGGEAHGAVSDEQAAEWLRLVHQRLGHSSLKKIRQLHRSGELLGPDISADQFECVQFFCPCCARTRQTRKPDSKGRRLPPEKLQPLSLSRPDARKIQHADFFFFCALP